MAPSFFDTTGKTVDYWKRQLTSGRVSWQLEETAWISEEYFTMGKTIDSLERQQKPHDDNEIKEKIIGMGWSPECWGLCANRGQTQQQNFYPVWPWHSTQTENQADRRSGGRCKICDWFGNWFHDEWSYWGKLYEVPNSLTLGSPKTNCKMSSEPQLDSHHRVSLESNSNDLPLSFDNGLGPDLLNTDICLPHVHQKRMKVFTTTETTMKSRINFPSPNDKIWGKIDIELDQIIPTIFPDSLCLTIRGQILLW